jgi:hypothetical protein
MTALQVARRTLLASICAWLVIVALGFVGILDPFGALALGSYLVVSIIVSALACRDPSSWLGRSKGVASVFHP